MAVDQGDLPRPHQAPPEQTVSGRPRLLFHVTGIGSEITDSMRANGLLAKSATLTPRIDIGTWYTGGEYLTFWYTERGDVDEGREKGWITPTKPVAEEKKTEMLEAIDNMDAPDYLKEAYGRIINEATTYLPADRLKAVARIGIYNPFATLLREDTQDFFENYSKEGRENLTAKVKAVLDRLNVKFFDPNFNNDTLANDMLRTYVEHHLSVIGEEPGIADEIKENNLKVLQSVKFEDPIHEKYRQMLIARIKKILSGKDQAGRSEPAVRG